MNARLILSAGLLVVLSASAGARAAIADEGSFQLPSNPAKWVNSPPLSLAALEGKGAVLWFYEESCPTCREKWPPLLALAKKYEGQPVLFIGVNSGNARADVEQYARGVRCTWPIIVDDTREFEQQCGVGEISLRNIHQVGYISPAGEFRRDNFNDLDGVVQKALSGARWRVEPAEVPAALRSAWLSVEFGNPAAAAAAIKKSLAAPQAEVKTAAAKLNEVVEGDMQQAAAAAKEQADAGDKWGAFKTYQAMAARFSGYDIPDEVRTHARELGADEQVKQELAGQKAVEAALKAAQTARTPAARRSVVTRLKRIANDFPGTEAAADAQKTLAQIGE